MPNFFASPVVCNTGPLLGLYRIDQIKLLSKLFPEVIIPREVRDEIVETPYADAGAIARELTPFKVLTQPAVPDPMLSAELDHGEAAVLTVARSLGVPRVILDERKGRRVATLVYGFQVKGTAGLLLAAKKRGFISQIGPLLQEMRANGYFLSNRLIEECLRAAGESLS
jgi:uncharacterized protein